MADGKIRVKPNDGDSIEVDRTIAMQWAPIKAMYEAFGTLDTLDKPIELSNVNTETLNKIIEWADNYKEEVTETDEVPPRRTRNAANDAWDKKYFEVKQQMLFEIIMASNYLGMTQLLDIACKTVADLIKGKTPEEVRRTFEIPNDLPALDSPTE